MIEDAWPQAAFDPRILSLPLIGTTAVQPKGTLFPQEINNLQRGYIKQDKSYYSGANAPIYACAFLYNPSMVEATYSIDSSATNLTLPQYNRSPQDTGVYLIGLATTVSFSLLFDRTYELNSGVPQGPNLPNNYPDQFPLPGGRFAAEDPRQIGVMADINALKRISGITTQISGVSWTDANNNAQTSNITGPMQQVPAWVHFGGAYAQNSLSYYGYISGMDVQYTHFSASMTPMRCAVAVSFTLLPQASPA